MKNVIGSKGLAVGMSIVVYGQTCVIRKVYDFGTCDVEAPSGKWYRVSGLSAF